ncbi:hypothetical protein AB0M36_01480 [Actinoplanes sp. NPDC051346]|uniref:hypothetical protein n=1 Tax=Actinoplanes sp. NPDC051346 TaxID=3155048 RepID=UPI003437CCC9
MVTRAMPTAGLPLLERAAVTALARLLPAGFRDRQRDEWTADLMTLASHGAAVRWRYLLAAMWTLPTLRSLVRSGRAGGPSGAVAAPVALALTARVLILGLGWPVMSWLFGVALRYVVYDVPARLEAGMTFDPKDLWPTDGVWVALTPLWIMLSLGAWAAVLGGPFLIGSLGLVATVAGPLRRGQSGRQRLTAALAGVGALAFVVGFFVLVGLFPTVLAEPGDYLISADARSGVTVGLLGVASIVFAAKARALAGRTRAALLLVGAGAVIVMLAHHVPLGVSMNIWFMD